MSNQVSIKEIDRRIDSMTQFRTYCKCGHSITLTRPYKLCSHCNHLVFKDKKEEMKYRVKEQEMRLKRK